MALSFGEATSVTIFQEVIFDIFMKRKETLMCSDHIRLDRFISGHPIIESKTDTKL